MHIQQSGAKRWMSGLRNAAMKGIAAAQDKNFTENDNPYKNYEHRQFWLDAFRTERKKVLVTEFSQKEQGERCACRGFDDYCPCQNVPDRQTLKNVSIKTKSNMASDRNKTRRDSDADSQH